LALFASCERGSSDFFLSSVRLLSSNKGDEGTSNIEVDMSSESITSSDEEETTDEADAGTEAISQVDLTLPARYAETMKLHSRLSSSNQPSMSSRVLLLGFIGLLFYYAIQSKWNLRLIKGKLSEVEYDKDYTGILLEEA
jgi:hypothetical protein